MINRMLAVSAAGLGLSLGVAGTASASEVTGAGGGFGGFTTVVDGVQSGVLAVDAPIVDLRCATPWYGSAVLGGSTPIGSQNVVCDDVKAVVTMLGDGDNRVVG